MLKPPPAIPGRGSKSAASAADKRTEETHRRILSGIAQRHLGIDDIHDQDTQDSPHTKSGMALHAAIRAAFDAGRLAK